MFPREHTITLYGRMPVLEALLDPGASIDKVVLARNARGESVDRIVAAAAERGVKLERADPHRVTRISRNGRHDQGVVADITSPGLAPLDGWAAPATFALVLLDGVTNPGNVGMIIRTVAAAGLDGVVLPHAGCPDVGPLVVKASAGVALRATILRAPSAESAAGALRDGGATVIGLAAGGGTPVWEAELPERAVFVVGNETDGVSRPVAMLTDAWWSIPLAGGVESLNVAAAAAVLAFEVQRQILSRDDASQRPGAPGTTS